MSSITMRLREGTTGAVAERDAEFAWFFRNEFEALVRTMYLIVHDREQARDIAQDAFVQLFTRWRRISQYEQPEAWVRRVGIRMAMRSVRRERLRPRLERELDVASLPKPVDVDVLRAVRRLPAAQRAAVVLFYFEDRPVAEVAGTVALAEAWTRWTDILGQVSDNESQFSERIGQNEGRTDIGSEIVEAPAEVLNEGVCGDDDPGGAVSLQPSHRSKSGLQASVVGLDAVVRMDLGVVEGRREHLIQHSGVDPVSVGGDLDGEDPGPIDGSLEEAAGRTGVPAR